MLTNFINAKTGIDFGGQDCHHLNEGAFTGCISAQMLKSAGCKYVIIGHSERREYQNETSKELNLKIDIANKYNLKIIIRFTYARRPRIFWTTINDVESK